MSRRPNQRFSRRASTGKVVAQASFAITNVSQTAGKVGGGTQLTVTATAISGTPTSTLGAVSNVTATTFQVATSAAPGGLAGSVAWTATNGDLSVSAVQTYTYLSAPSLNGISPTSGPATLANPGVTLGILNTPPAGSGCPITLTLGSGAGSNIAAAGANTLTADFAAPGGTGTASLTGTIDGVAITGGSGVFTLVPAPTLVSQQGVGTSGGSNRIGGTGFVNGCTAAITVSGSPVNCPVTFISSTVIQIAVPAEPVGLYDLTITNPDTQVGFASAFVNVTTVKTPATIFGSNLRGRWVASDSDNHVNGGAVTTVADSSGFGNTATFQTSKPTYNTTSSFAGGSTPSISHVAGSSQSLASASGVTLGANTLYVFAAVKMTKTAGSTSPWTWKGNSGHHLFCLLSNAGIVSVTNGTATAAWGASVDGVQCGFASGDVGTAGPANAVSATINNQTAATGSGAGSLPDGSGAFIIAANQAASVFATEEWCEYFIVDVLPSTQQFADAFAYLDLTHNAALRPQITSCTTVPVSTPWTARIAATNLSTNGVTAAVVISGVLTPMTVNRLVGGATGFIEVTTPSLTAGNYDVVVSNVDGDSATLNNGLVATATADPMNILGTMLVGQYEVDTLTGSVTAWPDKCGTLNSIGGGGGATFNAGTPSVVFDGSTNYMECASFDFGTSTPAPTYIAVIIPDSPSSGTQTPVGYANADALMQLSTGIPRTVGGSGVVVWTGSIAGLERIVTSTFAAGVNPTGTINVSNGTAQSGTLTEAAIPNGGKLSVGRRDNGTQLYKGQMLALYVLNAAASGGQLSSMVTYLKAKYPGLP
jgi:hypothetical protein